MAATNRTLRASYGVLFAAVCLLVQGGGAMAWDDQYLDRMDRISPGAGNAVAHNIAVQTINPWPWYAGNDRINIDGRRIALGHRRYQANRSVQPRSLDTSGLTFSSSSTGSGQNDAGSGGEQSGSAAVAGAGVAAEGK